MSGRNQLQLGGTESPELSVTQLVCGCHSGCSPRPPPQPRAQHLCTEDRLKKVFTAPLELPLSFPLVHACKLGRLRQEISCDLEASLVYTMTSKSAWVRIRSCFKQDWVQSLQQWPRNKRKVQNTELAQSTPGLRWSTALDQEQPSGCVQLAHSHDSRLKRLASPSPASSRLGTWGVLLSFFFFFCS